MEKRGRQLVRYIVPSVLGQVCYFLFVIVDGIFVGRGIGSEALAAVNIAFPYIFVANALYMLINIGGVSISAIRLGRGEKERANEVFHHSTLALLIVAALLSAIGLLFTDPLGRLMGAGDTYFDFVHDYLFHYSMFLIPSALGLGLQAYGRNDNAPGLVGATVIVITVLNIFLDWLLIFPFPMGTKGVALATGVSQTVGFLILLPHFLFKKGVFTFRLPKIKWSLYKEIALRGLPAGIGSIAPAVMTLCMNLVLADKIGDAGVNAFAVISYIASFAAAVFIGTGDGLQPLFGKTYGAGNKKDLRFYFGAGLIINFVGSIIVTALILAFSEPVCALFGAKGETLTCTLKALPLYVWGFVFTAFNTMIVSYLYSTEQTGRALILSLLRSIVLSAAVTFTVPAIFGGTSVWLTMGIYEALTLMVAVFMLVIKKRRTTTSNHLENT